MYVDTQLKWHLNDVADQQDKFRTARDITARDQVPVGANSDIDRAIREVKKLENMILRLRRSTNNILSSVNEQSRGPVGFARVWRTEPMILKDIYGKSLAIPLDVVDSWAMFDAIILEHFKNRWGRKFPDINRFKYREYLVRDPSTGVPLSKEQSWDSFV